ncbi:MAG: hypothetical protein IAF38_11010 [Bacteroidia bacterium]|nr:hypothetical protein [Bacteroidia bacterium]
MRHEENLEAYIQKKLAELEKQKDMQDVIYKGKLSFGIDSTTYDHLPAWNGLVKEKKQLVRLFWANAAFLSFMTVFIAGDFFEIPLINLWRDIIRLMLMAGFVMIVAVMGMYFSLFTKFRQTEREVRKLIYQDILFQLKKEEKIAA